MINEIIVIISQNLHSIRNSIKKVGSILSRDVTQIQFKRNLFMSDPRSMDPKEFFLLQCNGLELNRPDIIIRYLAVKDIANGNFEDGKGLRLYKKFWHGDGQDSELLVDKLTALVNSFADHGYNTNFCLTCDKKMEIFDGGHRLACALFFGEKTINFRKTITNWDQNSMWVRMINNGLSDEDVDFIRYESDLLVESIINTQNNTKVLDNDALIKLITKEYRKVHGFDKLELNGKSIVTLNNGGFYQSSPMLGIKGTRPTDIRIIQYGLRDLLNNEMDVLDIGCNIGFLDLEIAHLVRSVTGIEYNSEASKLSKKIAFMLNIYNATFINADFKEWENLSRRKYDVIFSFAVYHRIGLSPKESVAKISSLLKPSGYVFFEGHNLIEGRDVYDAHISEFINNGFRNLKSEYIMDDGATKRIWTLLQHNE